MCHVSCSNGVAEGWRVFDVFKRGKTAGLVLTDLAIKYPDADEPMLIVMLQEADDSKDRRLDFAEFSAVISVCVHVCVCVCVCV